MSASPDPSAVPLLRTAFLGLGNMGGPMAANLARAGVPLRVFDLNPQAAAAVVAAGAQLATSAEACVEGADVVVSMLPASRHVEALYLGHAGGGSGDGLLARLPAGTLVMDASTIAPQSARRVAEAAAARHIDFLDTPVSGGTAGAVAGSLTFMVGGEPAVLERARGHLNRMGANIFHAGAAGAGQATKVCNNMLLAIQMIGTSEALLLGQSLGLDPAVLSEVMRRSSGGNWVLEKYNPVPGVMPQAPASRQYQGGFGSTLMLKDLGLALEAAAGTGTRTPLGEHARVLYEQVCAGDLAGLDFSSVIRLLAENTDQPKRS